MTRSPVLLAMLVSLAVAPSAAAQDVTPIWVSESIAGNSSPWWALQLDQSVTIGSPVESALFVDGITTGLSFGVSGVVNIDHHWYVAMGLGVGFPLGTSGIAAPYDSVRTSVDCVDVVIAFRAGYLPLALSWMSLGIVAEMGLLIDSTSVTSGGLAAGGFAALGNLGGYASFSFFPHDAFEVGLRVGYRYLVGDRVALDSADADRLHVPAGPYRGVGDVVVVIQETIHF